MLLKIFIFMPHMYVTWIVGLGSKYRKSKSPESGDVAVCEQAAKWQTCTVSNFVEYFFFSFCIFTLGIFVERFPMLNWYMHAGRFMVWTITATLQTNWEVFISPASCLHYNVICPLNNTLPTRFQINHN